MTRRNLLQLALAGVSFEHFRSLSAQSRKLVKITDVKAMKLNTSGNCLIKIERDEPWWE